MKTVIKKKKIKILCLISNYLPGFRAGGPIITIKNFTEYFSKEFEIYIICSDRDFGDKKSYSDVKINSWNKIGNINIFYVSSKLILRLDLIFNILKNHNYDVLYLNSFFSFGFTMFPLIMKYFKIIKSAKYILAPRGVFSKSALAIKKQKKLIYLYITKKIGLYRNVIWQASSSNELKDIRKSLGIKSNFIKIAPDLISSKLKIKNNISKKKRKKLKIIFLSRISPMKNLDFLLKVLLKVRGHLELSIFGPKEDSKYWKKCIELIKKLPPNIQIQIGKEIATNDVHKKFQNYDLFAFPTKGENFGHIIVECLFAGTPILLSNNTFWRQDRSLGIQILSLNKKNWRDAIEKWINLPYSVIVNRKKAALNYSKKIIIKNKLSIIRNRQLFKRR